MNRIKVSAEAESKMKEHALATFPNECCGFFYGKNSGEGKQVTEVLLIENAKEGDQRRRFSISPLDYMKGERYAMEHELDFLGVYHSHPLHPAIPSEHDRVQAMPSFSYIILSTDPEEVVDVTSWQLNDDRQFDQEGYLILQTRTI